MTEQFTPAATHEAIDHYKRLATGKKVFVFCMNIAHAQETARAFNKANIPADSVTADMGRHEQIDRFTRFKTDSGTMGTIDVLCGVNALAAAAVRYGCHAEGVIMMMPTSILDRVERQWSTTRPPHLVIDMVGNVARLGIPKVPFLPRIFASSFVDKMTPLGASASYTDHVGDVLVPRWAAVRAIATLLEQQTDMNTLSAIVTAHRLLAETIEKGNT